MVRQVKGREAKRKVELPLPLCSLSLETAGSPLLHEELQDARRRTARYESVWGWFEEGDDGRKKLKLLASRLRQPGRKLRQKTKAARQQGRQVFT